MKEDESLFCEIIDALPLGVSCSVVFIAFFFFWGAAINLLNVIGAISGKSMPPLGNGPGVLVGSLGAILAALVIWKVKNRRK